MLPLMMLMMGGNQGPNQNMNLNPSPKLLSHFLSYLGQFKSKSHIQGHPQKVEKQSISFEKLDGISDLIVRVIYWLLKCTPFYSVDTVESVFWGRGVI